MDILRCKGQVPTNTELSSQNVIRVEAKKAHERLKVGCNARYIRGGAAE